MKLHEIGFESRKVCGIFIFAEISVILQKFLPYALYIENSFFSILVNFWFGLFWFVSGLDRNVYMYVNTLHTFRTYFNLITKNLNYSENYAYLKIQILSFQKNFVTWGKICPKSCRNFCRPPKFWKWFFRYFCASKQKKNIFSCFASKLGSFKKKIQKKNLNFFRPKFPRARMWPIWPNFIIPIMFLEHPMHGPTSL